jgi:tetratricopeptide (TPR) repeat protein
MSGDAEFYYNRGVSYLVKGQHDLAISDLTKALEINPNLAEAYDNRGNAYYLKDQLDQAISDYTKAIKIDPGHAEAYFNRGVAYYFKKEYHKSWEDIRKASGMGYQVPSEFLDYLRKASGREK